jgi:hypothetical protein
MARSIVLAALAMFASSAFAADSVSVTGCPVAGVEAGCIVIKDKDSGKTYDITSIKSGSKPFDLNQNLVVQLTGTPSDKATICMQGTPLENIEWDYTKMKCEDESK